MKTALFAGLLGALLTTTMSISAKPSTEATANKAIRLRDRGDFRLADALLQKRLQADGLPEPDRLRLTRESEMLARLRQDYSRTEEQLFAELDKAVRHLSRDEFNRWVAAGRFDSRIIDGVRRFVGTSVSNLFFRHPELEARRVNPKNGAAHQHALLDISRAIRAEVRQRQSPYVLPHAFKVTMTDLVAANAAPAGETLRVWMPIPRQYPFQTAGSLVSSTPQHLSIAPESSPIRSVYFEQPARADTPSKFQIVYTYTNHGIRFDLNPAASRPYQAGDPVVAQYTRPGPHTLFTDRLLALSRQITGPETNRVRQARAFYDWIGANIAYSYAREYATLGNISDYCLTNRYGDCGQQALLFIALCRAAGIPARWQSGWLVSPQYKTMHDWSEIYLQPWGWVPVDPEVGNAAARYFKTLTLLEGRELADFYFGGLDPYRLMANCDHSQPLDPAKKWWRSDDVDFQRGEIEWRGGNLFFDRFSYQLDFDILSAPSPH